MNKLNMKGEPEEVLDFVEEARKYFLSRFTKGLLLAEKANSWNEGESSYFLSGYLIRDWNDEPSRIRGNDPINLSLLLTYKEETGEFELNKSGGRGIAISAVPNKPYMAMSHRKVSYRKAKGDYSRVMKNFTSVTKRLADLYKELERDGELFHPEYVKTHKVR